MFQKLLFQIQLIRYMRLQRRTSLLHKRLNLTERFPEHGRYEFGNVEVFRDARTGGRDFTGFFSTKPKLLAKVPTKPPVEYAKVQPRPRTKVDA